MDTQCVGLKPSQNEMALQTNTALLACYIVHLPCIQNALYMLPERLNCVASGNVTCRDVSAAVDAEGTKRHGRH